MLRLTRGTSRLLVRKAKKTPKSGYGRYLTTIREDDKTSYGDSSEMLDRDKHTHRTSIADHQYSLHTARYDGSTTFNAKREHWTLDRVLNV